MSSKKYRELPPLVFQLLRNHNGWLVGSAAKWFIGMSEEYPRDFDVIVPFSDWEKASCTISQFCRESMDNFDKLTLSSFGALKLLGVHVPNLNTFTEIDVWPDNLERFMGGNHYPIIIKPWPEVIVIQKQRL